MIKIRDIPTGALIEHLESYFDDGKLEFSGLSKTGYSFYLSVEYEGEFYEMEIDMQDSLEELQIAIGKAIAEQ